MNENVSLLQLTEVNPPEPAKPRKYLNSFCTYLFYTCNSMNIKHVCFTQSTIWIYNNNTFALYLPWYYFKKYCFLSIFYIRMQQFFRVCTIAHNIVFRIVCPHTKQSPRKYIIIYILQDHLCIAVFLKPYEQSPACYVFMNSSFINATL